MTKMSSPTDHRASRRAARKSSPDRLSAGASLAWTSTGVSAGVNFILIGYFVFYGTDVLGINAAVLGTLALLSKVIEAGVVILAGWLVDRSPETRWGKARPYELAIVGVWAATWMLFSTPDLNKTAQTIWLFVTLVAANALFTSLLSANDTLYLARAFRGRVLLAKVTTRTGLFTVLGVVAANVVLPQLVSQVGTSAPAWSSMVLFIAIPMTIIGLGRFFFSREKYQTEAANAPRVTFRDIADVLRNNRYIWIIAAVTFVSTLSGSTGITIYYFKYLVGDISLMSIVAIVPILVLPAMLVFPRLMKKIGISMIITGGAVSGTLGGLIIAVSNGNLLVFVIGTLLLGLATLPVTFLVSLLIIDNATYNQWSGRRRLESTMGAISGFSQRLGVGLGGALTGWVLGVAGYNAATVEQPAAVTTSILVLAGIMPAVAWFAVIFIIRPYRRLENMLPTITQELSTVLTEEFGPGAAVVAEGEPEQSKS